MAPFISFILALLFTQSSLKSSRSFVWGTVDDQSTSAFHGQNSTSSVSPLHRWTEDDLYNLISDDEGNAAVRGYHVVTINLETGQRRKVWYDYNRAGIRIDVPFASQKWTDFTGLRYTSSQAWQRYSANYWNEVKIMTGTVDSRNIGTFLLLGCTGALLINGKFATLGHFTGGISTFRDDAETIQTINQLVIEEFNDEVQRVRGQAPHPKLYISRNTHIPADRGWEEVSKFIAVPHCAPSSSLGPG